MTLPAQQLQVDGGVKKRSSGGDGVDVTAVEGTGEVRLGSTTAEGSDGLADLASRSNFDKTDPFLSCS